MEYFGYNYFNGNFQYSFNEDVRSYPYFYLDYNMDYKLFKFMSLYGLTGFNYYTKYGYSFWKIGGGLKFYFFNSETTYFNLGLADMITLNNSKAIGGTEINFGLNFRATQIDEKSIILKVMYDYTFLDIAENQFQNELGSNNKAKNLVNRAFGLGVGFRF